MGINGLLVLAIPFIKNFGLLVTVKCLQSLFLGAHVTADASLVVYTMGPKVSRPFTQVLHAMIGVGFLAATFLVKPFLPSEEVDVEAVCSPSPDAKKDSTFKTEHLWGLDKTTWPFIITGSWCIISSLGFLILAVLPLKMPRYYTDDEDKPDDGSHSHPEPECKIRYFKTFLALVFVYYFITCGIERIYQPMVIFASTTKKISSLIILIHFPGLHLQPLRSFEVDPLRCRDHGSVIQWWIHGWTIGFHRSGQGLETADSDHQQSGALLRRLHRASGNRNHI